MKKLLLLTTLLLSAATSCAFAEGFDQALKFLRPADLSTLAASSGSSTTDYLYVYDASVDNIVKVLYPDILQTTADSAELDVLDGFTGTTAELNYVDLATLGTGAASKAIVLDASGDYTFPATATIVMPASGSMTFAASSTLAIAATAAHTGGITGDGGDALVGFLQSQTASTTTSAAAAQCGGTFVSNSADVMTLPEASTVLGCQYTFVCGTADDLDINPADGTDVIGTVASITGANTTTVLAPAAGDAIRCTDIGSSIVIEAVGANLWASIGTANGIWTDVN